MLFIFRAPKPTSSSSHNSAPSTPRSASSSASNYINHLSSRIVTSATPSLTFANLITRLQLTNARMMNPSKFPHTSAAIYSTQPGIWRIIIFPRSWNTTGLFYLYYMRKGICSIAGLISMVVNIKMRVLAPGVLRQLSLVRNLNE